MHNIIKTLFYLIVLTAAASQLCADRFLLVPFGLATDKVGNVYVADLKGGRGAIYKYDPNGARLFELTDGFSNNGIGAIAVDKANDIIYFTTPNSPNSPRLWKSDPKSQVPYKPQPFGPPSLTPTGLAVDSAGNVYISGGIYLEKFHGNGDFVCRVDHALGNASKVLGVDSQNRVYYTATDGKKLKRATLQSDGLYTCEEVPTSGACDAMAIDDADNLYIADKTKRTIRKHDPDRKESDLLGRYGDLRTLAVFDKRLYIANGIDGVLKVDADSGKCAGTRLFQIQKPYDYFVRHATGKYYLSYTYNVDTFNSEASVDLYNSDGTFDLQVKKGKRAKGLALDKDGALAFTMMSETDQYGGSKLCLRQLSGELQEPCVQPEGVAYFEAHPGRAPSLLCKRFFVAQEKDGQGVITAFFIDTWLHILCQGEEVVRGVKGLRGLAANDNGYVYWVSTQDKVIGRAYLNNCLVWDSYDVNQRFITDLDDPEAVAADRYNWVYVTNSPESEEKRRIGRYSPEGSLLSELYADGMRNRYADRMYLRGLIADNDGRDITVLQRFGNLCEVWQYSNIFAN